MDRRAFVGVAAMAAAVLAVSSVMAKGNVASVVDVGGVPRFAIDGKPMTATAVMPSPAGKPGEAHKQLKAFREAGALLSSDVWTMHDKRYNPRQWWLGEGEYDFELFDALAKGLVDASPDGFIFPRLKIDPPPKWCEAHSNEMMSAISPYPESTAWRSLYRRMLKDVIDHVEVSSYADRVIGYHIGAFHCGEWLTGEWGRKNRAYIPSVPCGEEDPLASAEVTAARRAVLEGRANAVADMLIDAASCVKEFTGGRRLVGAFFGYPSIAHEKVSRVIRSGQVDFFAAPPIYHAVREPGHSGRSQTYYQASYRLHNRVYYEESDFRTFLSNPAFSPPNQTRRRPLDESLGIVRRSIGKCLAGGWENWWFLLGGNDTFSAPELMESIRIGAKEERDTLFTARWTPAEVAVFTAADEYATSGGTHAPKFRLACKENLHRDALPACGVPFDSYELADIADPRLPDYKVYVFPNAFTLSDAMREKIKERVCRKGKTAVWIYRAPDGLGEGCQSVVLPLSPTAARLRKTFREAGAHVWMETDDVFAAGRGYVMVHAATDGEKTVRLQNACDAREIFGASPAQSNVTTLSAWLKRGETRVWKIVERPKATVPRFGKAEPVWAKGQSTEMNSSVRFKAAFNAEANAEPFLLITGTSAYRIRLNGRYVGYGPARSPKGFFRVDEWPLAAAIREGRNELEIDAAGYNCNSFYYQDQPAFVQAEVVANGKVLAATTAEGGDFSAESTERVRKVPRYSFQRTFAEAYRCGGGEPAKLALERRPPVCFLDRIASYPKFEMNGHLRFVSRAKVVIDPQAKIKAVRFVNTDGKDPLFKAFPVDELESNLWAEAQRLVFSDRVPCAPEPGEPFVLRGDESAQLDAGLNDCGFFGMTVKVAKPGRILFIFDEVLTDGRVSPTRMTCCNCVEWRFERPGTYEVETFEPYVFRYAELVGLGGAFEVSGLRVRAYKNPDAGRVAFRCSDPALEKVFEAARETFVQNAVDVFTDCPSRERAGWLCDSFFIGRVNKLLTGDTKLERLFLQNFAVSDGYEHIPAGAIPMCYPADQLNGQFIPNWAMWLVIEVEEYLKRSGDRATVDALKPRLVAFIDYMKTFRNSDGLLEKLPSWVFVEWSRANSLVQDVNYPSNMTWAEVLDVMNRLYGMPELAAEAERVRETVRRQSWTGEWFCDNAVRQKDGSLKLSGECTETCQYYAFFFRTATPKTHPKLWKTLVEDFGPKRLAEDRKTLKSHPAVWPSNAFIGNYLRLECLAREGLAGNILNETKDFFLYMAERTGTLWEMISPTASCNHGFASHAAVYLFRDILGVKSVDVKSRKVLVDPPKDIDLDWCEGTLPVSPDETVTIRWRRGEKPTVDWGRVEK